MLIHVVHISELIENALEEERGCSRPGAGTPAILKAVPGSEYTFMSSAG